MHVGWGGAVFADLSVGLHRRQWFRHPEPCRAEDDGVRPSSSAQSWIRHSYCALESATIAHGISRHLKRLRDPQRTCELLNWHCFVFVLSIFKVAWIHVQTKWEKWNERCSLVFWLLLQNCRKQKQKFAYFVSFSQYFNTFTASAVWPMEVASAKDLCQFCLFSKSYSFA